MKTNVKNMTLVNKADSTRKAHCSIIIEDAIALNDIWVVEGKNGLFVSFPQRPYEDRESGETKYASNVIQYWKGFSTSCRENKKCR